VRPAQERTIGSGERLHGVRCVITFGVKRSIIVPAATPSLEMALEIAQIVSDQLPVVRPDLKSSGVRVWLYADVAGHPDPEARGDLVARFNDGKRVN
jgi:hypothetical protein